MKKIATFFKKLVLTLFAIFFGILPMMVAGRLIWLFMTDKFSGPVATVLFDWPPGAIISFGFLLIAQISFALLSEAVIQNIWSRDKKSPQAQV